MVGALNNHMIKYIVILCCATASLASAQKPFRFYDEKGNDITGKAIKSKVPHIIGFGENDSIKFGVSLKREKVGTLSALQFNKLKEYLELLCGSPIDAGSNIVVNYISALPKIEEKSKERSKWNMLEFPNTFTNQLRKQANARQFWVSSPLVSNLRFYHGERIDWLKDEQRIISELFFPYEIPDGSFVLIKPDGSYVYYLGEHEKMEFWTYVEVFLKGNPNPNVEYRVHK